MRISEAGGPKGQRNEAGFCFYTDIVPPVQVPHGGADHPNVAWFNHQPASLTSIVSA